MTEDVHEEMVDRAARLIAAAVFCPQPEMSGDIWKRLSAQKKRHCEDAAREVLADLFWTPVTEHQTSPTTTETL